MQFLDKLFNKQPPSAPRQVDAGTAGITDNKIVRAAVTLEQISALTDGNARGYYGNVGMFERTYTNSSIVRACINTITNAFLKAELTAPAQVKVLLDNPNPIMTRQQFWQLVLSSYYTTGFAFIFKSPVVPGRFGKITANEFYSGSPIQYTNITGEITLDQTEALFPMKSSSCIWAPGPWAKPFRSFFYSDGYNSFRLENPQATTIMLMKFSNWDTMRPTSPLQSAWREVQIDWERQEYQREALRALPNLINMFETEDDSYTNAKQRQLLAEQISKLTQGASLVLPPRVKANTAGIVDDLPLGGLTSQAESRICAVYNISPMLVGLQVGLEHSIYNNFSEARDAFISETMCPLCEDISAAVSKAFDVEVKFEMPEEEPDEELVEADRPISEGNDNGN